MIKYLIRSLLSFLLFILVMYGLLWVANFLYQQAGNKTHPRYGVTFSPYYAEKLGLNYMDVYQNILSDLNIKYLRIPVYWDLSEPGEGKFDFSATDRLLDLAQKNNVKVILAIGYKVPRWPECFEPDWAVKLDPPTHNKKLLDYLAHTINHFKDRNEITAWQIENEPLYDFGVCKQIKPELLIQEVELVRKLDRRPILITQSGEMRIGRVETSLADEIGTSIYRKVWNPKLGFIEYPIPPVFYSLKYLIVKTVFAPNSRGILITELQAEPWPAGTALTETPIPEQLKIFSLNDFKEVINYAGQTGFSNQYLWGVEWWYFMKLQGHPEYWEYAKTLFK